MRPEPHDVDLKRFVDCFAALKRVDERRPVAVRQTNGEPFQPGIGPHTETAAVALAMSDLADHGEFVEHRLGVWYPRSPRQKCDICIGTPPRWDWVLEVKLLRFMGDNGRPNDNILMHILSPYPAHRSALTDCGKLASSGFEGRKGIVIYGVRAPRLAARAGVLGPRRTMTSIVAVSGTSRTARQHIGR